MGRALPKRFFGNVNTNDSGDNKDTFNNATGEGIGGDSVASVTLTNQGVYSGRLPTVTFSDPDLAGVGGVTATGIVHGEVNGQANTTANGSGYTLNEQLSIVGGTYSEQAIVSVASLTVVGITLNNGGSANDVGDEFTFSVSGFSTPLRVRVTASSGGVASAVSIVNGGVWTTGALPSNTIGMTRVQVAAGQDYNGTGLQVNITAWGVYAFASSPVDSGDYTVVPSNPVSFTGATGSGAHANINWDVKYVEITDEGSGYTSVADAAPTFSTAGGGETRATGASVLTVDTNDSTYERDSFDTLLAYAYVTGNNLLGDIVKQQSTRQYKMKTSEGTAKCVLKAGTPSAVGEMSINAIDSDGGTYWVTKMTHHLVTLTPNTGTQFAADTRAQWVLGTPVNGVSVKLDNA